MNEAALLTRCYNVLVYNHSVKVLSKLKSREFRATSLSTYDFSTLYTTLPHNLSKEKLLESMEVSICESPFSQFYRQHFE